jgi:hypothetical protein
MTSRRLSDSFASLRSIYSWTDVDTCYAALFGRRISNNNTYERLPLSNVLNISWADESGPLLTYRCSLSSVCTATHSQLRP